MRVAAAGYPGRGLLPAEVGRAQRGAKVPPFGGTSTRPTGCYFRPEPQQCLVGRVGMSSCSSTRPKNKQQQKKTTTKKQHKSSCKSHQKDSTQKPVNRITNHQTTAKTRQNQAKNREERKEGTKRRKSIRHTRDLRAGNTRCL